MMGREEQFFQYSVITHFFRGAGKKKKRDTVIYVKGFSLALKNERMTDPLYVSVGAAISDREYRDYYAVISKLKWKVHTYNSMRISYWNRRG